MMKQLSIIFLFIFCFFACYSQTTPSVVPRSNDVIVASDGGIFARNTMRPPVFLDTTAANNSLYLLDSCGRQIFTYADNSYWLRACSPKRWIKVLKSGDAIVSANNGLSISGNTVQLGGVFTKSDTLNYNGDSLHLLNGWTRIKGAAGSQPLLRLENTTSGGSEQLYIVGDMASIRMFANGASPFAAITQYDAGVLKNSYGYDGPANHVFLTDLRNGVNSATFEINGSTLAGFSGATGNLWGGQGTAPDTAALNLFRVGTALTSPSQQMLLYGANYGATYNTTSGAIVNRMVMLDNSASRSAGGNNLTNTALYLRARNGQVNYGLYVDSGRVIVHNDFSSTSSLCVDDFPIVNNTSSTQPRSAAHLSRSVRYNDNDAGTETFAAGVYAQTLYQAKASVILPDNLSGAAGLESAFFARRNTAYTGAVLFQGSNLPTNAVTTMPSALVARFDMSAAQTGGNSIRAQGYWAGFTSWAVMNAGNSIGRFAWINTGAAQETGGAIDTGYAIYINTLPSLVNQKYAIRQEGSADTNYLAGLTRLPNLVAQTDTALYKPVARSASGTLVAMSTWPGGGSGGGGSPKAGKSIRISGTDTVNNRVDVGDSSYAVVAGVIRGLWDTATNQNVWSWISNTDHGNINIKDSVVTSSSVVSVFYDSSTYQKVVTFLIVPDETVSRIAQTTANFQGKANSLYYSNGGYTAGASVGLTSAAITFSKLLGLSVQVYWNGSAWVMAHPFNTAINFNSTPPTITYSAGRLRIQNLPFNMRENPVAMQYAINGLDSMVGYKPAIEVISSTWVDIYFWDSKNNVKFTAATPPTNFGVYLNFGTTWATLNPVTEDMGFNSNWWVIAIMKKSLCCPVIIMPFKVYMPILFILVMSILCFALRAPQNHL